MVVSCGSHPIFAQDSVTDTGKKAADKYFLKRKRRPSNQESSPPPVRKGPTSSSKNFAGAPRYLALQFGLFTEEETYKWGKSNKNDVSEYMIGITYRIGEWTNSMDLAIRADLVSFEVDDKSPTKLSLLPIVTFPDAKSGFPLYFGAGIGAGIFFKQAKEESHLSLDYQILAGARFFNLVSSMGLIFEAGLKNQLFLLSDGQHNGVYGSIGGVFTF
ncbi:MAG: hypothetical protein KDD58_10290 [Bdellovibrionales bacterium]|nr:hypothetical protein [Bdellovibrionales bacterium]